MELACRNPLSFKRHNWRIVDTGFVKAKQKHLLWAINKAMFVFFFCVLITSWKAGSIFLHWFSFESTDNPIKYFMYHMQLWGGLNYLLVEYLVALMSNWSRLKPRELRMYEN